MREISTKPIEIGEHVLIDGVEYVAEAHGRGCAGCAFRDSDCEIIRCGDSIMVKVEKPTETQNKDTPMTNHELAMWCAKGFGQWKHSPSNSGTVYHTYWVMEDKEDCFVEANIVIRPWGTDEWVKPTVEIYERDCR